MSFDSSGKFICVTIKFPYEITLSISLEAMLSISFYPKIGANEVFLVVRGLTI